MKPIRIGAKSKKETDVNKQIIDAYHKMGIKCWRNNSGGVKRGGRWISLSPPGTPDIIGYWPNGKFLGIENKSNGEPLSGAQGDFAYDAIQSGAKVIIVKSLDEAIEYAVRGEWKL